MIREFHHHFGSSEDIRVYRAPGRVNLIGEHTDYNQGLVLPMALELATYVATAPSPDGKLRLDSEARSERYEIPAAEVAAQKPAGAWTDYAIGVAQQIIRAGFPVAPANLLIRSTVPEGAGLSSSAALQVSIALALLNGREFPPLELARLCQRAEQEFVGMPCGIMDQYISVFGQEHSAVKIDCRRLDYQLVPLPRSMVFVAVNTMVKHALAGSAYEHRVQECEAAARACAVESLRDVTPAQLDAVSGIPGLLKHRLRHVVNENDRVERFIDATRHGDRETMGRLMLESHRSLQTDYQVSCAELDFLVDAALGFDGVFGSRMTGGGFGGCTVNLMRPDVAAVFPDRIRSAYAREFGVTPEVYECNPGRGAGEVKNLETIPAGS